MNRFLKQLSLALLTCTLTLATTASAYATSFFDYSGTSIDGHTITGFIELSIPVPVVSNTGVIASDVVDSGFNVSGPIFNQTFMGSDLGALIFSANIGAPHNFNCFSCAFWNNGVAVLLFNGPSWTIGLVGNANIRASGPGNWTFRSTGNNPVPEPSTLILLGTGLAGIVVWRRKMVV